MSQIAQRQSSGAARSMVRMRASWASVAFVVESVLLLVFLVTSFAVLTQVFSLSLNRSVESRTLDAATIAATSVAEHFAADPANVDEVAILGDLRVTCTVTEEQRQSGVLYKAHIAAYKVGASNSPDEEPVYAIDTSAYRSEVG